MAPSAIDDTAPGATSMTFATGLKARQAARSNTWTSWTSGLAPSYIQANLIILPSSFATDFRLLCHRNPVPCPLLAESRSVGSFGQVKSWLKDIPDSAIAIDLDIRRDAPRYMVYRDGVLTEFEAPDITKEWTSDHVAFLIGCSYSFETALAQQGLMPRQIIMERNVPMYRTNIPLCPAGVFTGATYVVSMRPYREDQIEAVRDITRPYVATHGEPMAWGWDAVRRLGIKDINAPEWGDEPLTLEGRALKDGNEKGIVPVFWGCGVTPQEAVMRANIPGTVMAHAPGHMLVLDVREQDILGKV